MRELTTLQAFRQAFDSGEAIVITDTNGKRFHLHPSTCGHVTEDYFITKVIENNRRNGKYFAVRSRAEAEGAWPDVADCWT